VDMIENIIQIMNKEQNMRPIISVS